MPRSLDPSRPDFPQAASLSIDPSRSTGARTGPDSTRPDSTRPDSTRPDSTGPDSGGPGLSKIAGSIRARPDERGSGHPIIVCGLGPIGVRIAELARVVPGIAALVDLNPAAARERLGAAWRSEPVFPDLGSALDRHPGAPVVLCTLSDFAAIVGDLELAVRHGSSVVTTCEEAVWPIHRHPALHAQLDALAAAAGVSILGAGINPGFLMDFLPAALATPFPPASILRIERRVDARRRRRPLQEKIGVGLSPAEFDARRRQHGIGHRGLEESMALLGAALGVQWDQIHSTVEPVLVESTLQVGEHTLAAGQVAGMRNRGMAHLGDRHRLELDLLMAVTVDDPVDRIELLGPPPLPVCWEVRGGVPGDDGTAHVVLAALARLGSLPAGLCTLLDVPGGLRAQWGGRVE